MPLLLKCAQSFSYRGLRVSRCSFPLNKLTQNLCNGHPTHTHKTVWVHSFFQTNSVVHETKGTWASWHTGNASKHARRNGVSLDSTSLAQWRECTAARPGTQLPGPPTHTDGGQQCHCDPAPEHSVTHIMGRHRLGNSSSSTSKSSSWHTTGDTAGRSSLPSRWTAPHQTVTVTHWYGWSSPPHISPSSASRRSPSGRVRHAEWTGGTPRH